MQLLYWPVIVLSVSVANVVSESQVGGLTAHTIVPSPTPDCWGPSCLTWSQQIPHSASPLTPLSPCNVGEYVLHEYVEVPHVESLSMYGTRSEVNGSARENQVVINRVTTLNLIYRAKLTGDFTNIMATAIWLCWLSRKLQHTPTETEPSFRKLNSPPTKADMLIPTHL